MKNFILFIFPIILLCSGCSPKLGLTVTERNAPRPELVSENEADWMSYWRGQFQEYRGNVLAPTESYSETARTSYQKVYNQWADAEAVASLKSSLALTGFGLLATVVGVLVVLGAY